MSVRLLPALVAAAGLAAGIPASAATIVLGSVDFEAPAFTAGLIGDGQAGWYNPYPGAGPAVISTDRAHSGTQSLRTGASAAWTSITPFDIGFASDWWAQAWVWVTPGGRGADLTFTNVFGTCPVLEISGAGQPYFNSCRAQDVGQPNQGANVLGQWLLVRMFHVANVDYNGIRFNVIGDNVNITSYVGPYSGPGGGNPFSIDVSGDAYWDDVSWGYGEFPVAPAVVPVPAAGALLLSSLAALGLLRRRSA